MEQLSETTRLDGTLDVLVAENGIHVAHITSVSNPRFKGMFVTIRHGKACSRLGLGLSLFATALSVLRADNHLTDEELTDLHLELEELIAGNYDLASAIPF